MLRLRMGTGTRARATVMVTGVCSTFSLATGVVRRVLGEGRDGVWVTCKDEETARRVREDVLAPGRAWSREEDEEWDARRRIVVDVCDLTSEESIVESVARFARDGQGKLKDEGTNDSPLILRGVLHAVAHAPREATRVQSVMDVRWEDWDATLRTSAWSLPLLVKHTLPGLKAAAEAGLAPGVVALTFNASSWRVVPGYEAMAPAKSALETLATYLASELGPFGVRVNCVSAGPVKTPAARGLRTFSALAEVEAARSALQRGVTHDDVSNVAVFLMSPLAAGVTGQTVFVDAGAGLRSFSSSA